MVTRLLVVSLILLCIGERASAVILYAREQRNTDVPTGSLANSGWQWEGKFGNFLGTAISKKDFITAGHIGGDVGDYFYYNGTRFKTIAMYDDPRSDLRIWHVKQTLPTHAPLYVGSQEKGKTAMIFGRGTARGDEVRVNGELKGWHWKDYDFIQSWGQNVISDLPGGVTDDDRPVSKQHIGWKFDRKGLPNEGIISDGDSGGGVFIKDGTSWKLAGINHDVQSTFSLPDAPDDSFQAAIFDAGGLIDGDGNLIPNTSRDIAMASTATRISSRSAWISDVIAGRVSASFSAQSFNDTGVPEPGTIGLIAAAGALFTLRRRSR